MPRASVVRSAFALLINVDQASKQTKEEFVLKSRWAKFHGALQGCCPTRVLVLHPASEVEHPMDLLHLVELIEGTICRYRIGYVLR